MQLGLDDDPALLDLGAFDDLNFFGEVGLLAGQPQLTAAFLSTLEGDEVRGARCSEARRAAGTWLSQVRKNGAHRVSSRAGATQAPNGAHWATETEKGRAEHRLGLVGRGLGHRRCL